MSLSAWDKAVSCRRRPDDAEQQISDAREEPEPPRSRVDRYDPDDYIEQARAQGGDREAQAVADACEIDEPMPRERSADAREEPEPMFVRGTVNCEHPGYNGTATLDDSLTITGPELAAYRQLQAAAGAAHAAQQSMASTGTALREAIQGLCAELAPAAKP